MINRLNGTVIESSDNFLTLDVNGVGYGIAVARMSSYEVGKSATIHTALQWNQETGPALYGFATPSERSLFLLITSCSGIGPKIGLAILGSMTPAQFIAVVQRADQDALSAINGIGPKKAEQMIMHLKHKVTKLVDSNALDLPGEPSGASTARQEIAQVLKSLNYSKQEISGALHYLNENYKAPNMPFDQLMRHALGFLAKRI